MDVYSNMITTVQKNSTSIVVGMDMDTKVVIRYVTDMFLNSHFTIIKSAEITIWLTHVSRKGEKVVGKVHPARKKCKLFSAKFKNCNLCHNLECHRHHLSLFQPIQCAYDTMHSEE